MPPCRQVLAPVRVQQLRTLLLDFDVLACRVNSTTFTYVSTRPPSPLPYHTRNAHLTPTLCLLFFTTKAPNVKTEMAHLAEAQHVMAPLPESQLPHKIVILLFIITNQNNKWTAKII